VFLAGESAGVVNKEGTAAKEPGEGDRPDQKSTTSIEETKQHLSIPKHRWTAKRIFRVQYTKLQIQTMMDDGCPPLFKFQILMGDSYYLI